MSRSKSTAAPVMNPPPILVASTLGALGVSREAIAWICAHGTVRRCFEEQVLYEPLSPTKCWTLVVSGTLLGSVQSAGNTFSPFLIFGSGAWFPDHKIILKENRMYQIKAVVPSTVFELSAEKFLAILGNDPSFAMALNRLQAFRFSKTLAIWTAMRMGTPDFKVAFTMTHITEAIGNKVYGERFTAPASVGLAVPLSQAQVAALCDVSRTTLSGFIKVMLPFGFLSSHYGKLVIEKHQVWRVLAQRMEERMVDYLGMSAEALACAMQNIESQMQQSASTE